LYNSSCIINRKKKVFSPADADEQSGAVVYKVQFIIGSLDAGETCVFLFGF